MYKICMQDLYVHVYVHIVYIRYTEQARPRADADKQASGVRLAHKGHEVKLRVRRPVDKLSRPRLE